MKTHENAESKINMADNFSLQQKEIFAAKRNINHSEIFLKNTFISIIYQVGIKRNTCNVLLVTSTSACQTVAKEILLNMLKQKCMLIWQIKLLSN
jgi:hypothetical protein